MSVLSSVRSVAANVPGSSPGPEAAPRPIVKAGIHLAVAFTALQLIFLTLTLLAAAVPDRPVVTHLRQAAVGGQMTARDYVSDPLGDTVDRYTDCIGLTTDVSGANSGSLLQRAVSAADLGPCSRAVPSLVSSSIQRGRAVATPYPRYWHGYTVWSRPLLATLGVRSLRLATVLALLGSLGLLCWITSRGRRWWLSVAMVSPLVLTTDLMAVAGSVPHAVAMTTAFIGVSVVWRLVTPKQPLGWFAYPALAGSLYAFVDLMTNPPLAWTLTVVAVVTKLFLSDESARPSLRRALLLSTTGWVAGYAGTWATKWVLVLVVQGPGALRHAVVDQILFRLGGAYRGLDLSPWVVLLRNARAWLGSGSRAVFVVAALGAALYLLASERRRRAQAPRDAIWLLLPGLIPPLWLGAVRNQSAIHAWFTYRSLAGTVSVALITAIALRVERGSAAGPPGHLRLPRPPWRPGALRLLNGAHPRPVQRG